MINCMSSDKLHGDFLPNNKVVWEDYKLYVNSVLKQNSRKKKVSQSFSAYFHILCMTLCYFVFVHSWITKKVSVMSIVWQVCNVLLSDTFFYLCRFAIHPYLFKLPFPWDCYYHFIFIFLCSFNIKSRLLITVVWQARNLFFYFHQ